MISDGKHVLGCTPPPYGTGFAVSNPEVNDLAPVDICRIVRALKVIEMKVFHRGLKAAGPLAWGFGLTLMTWKPSVCLAFGNVLGLSPFYETFRSVVSVR